MAEVADLRIVVRISAVSDRKRRTPRRKTPTVKARALAKGFRMLKHRFFVGIIVAPMVVGVSGWEENEWNE